MAGIRPTADPAVNLLALTVPFWQRPLDRRDDDDHRTVVSAPRVSRSCRMRCSWVRVSLRRKWRANRSESTTSVAGETPLLGYSFRRRRVAKNKRPSARERVRRIVTGESCPDSCGKLIVADAFLSFYLSSALSLFPPWMRRISRVGSAPFRAKCRASLMNEEKRNKKKRRETNAFPASSRAVRVYEF